MFLAPEDAEAHASAAFGKVPPPLFKRKEDVRGLGGRQQCYGEFQYGAAVDSKLPWRNLPRLLMHRQTCINGNRNVHGLMVLC